MTTECNIQWEVTDTYGGKANYAWVKRGSIPCGSVEFSDLAAVRRVKKAIGWAGVHCKVENWGDTIVLYPVGMAQVCFIDFHSFGSAS